MNRTSCPGCGHRLKFADQHAGKRAKCPKCSHSFQLPNVSSLGSAKEAAAPAVSQSDPAAGGSIRVAAVSIGPQTQVGPYVLMRELGRGGFGSVWLAERRTTLATTQVAIKLPLESQPDIEAIRQEAQLWAQASGHPNVLPVIEAAVYEGQVVIVSEYAPDGSVASWLQKNGGRAPSPQLALGMTCGILAGLSHLHAKRIVHRDLKPANVLLQGQYPRLTDFGLSRILKSTALTTHVAGTPAYMAPEAWDGKRFEQTDLWAAGVLLYEMLCGTLPFPSPEIVPLMKAILMDPPAPLPNDVPPPVRAVVERALEKDPQRRYQSAAEMLHDLQVLNGQAWAASARPVREEGLWDRVKRIGSKLTSGVPGPPARGDSRPAASPVPPPVRSKPARPSSVNRNHPLGGVEDAAELFKAIAKECCEYDDGSGDVDGKAARRLFAGLTAGGLEAALSASTVPSLAKLATLCRKLSEKIGPPSCRELEEVRSTAAQAIRALLPQAADAGEIKTAVAAVCCEYDDGSGEAYSRHARQLFDGLDVNSLAPVLAESALRHLNNLAHLLGCIAEKIGRPRCEGLEQLRAAIDEAARPAFGQVSQELAQAADADEMRKVIVTACCEYDDGSGDVNGEAVRLLFDGFTPAAVSEALSNSSLKGLSGLLKTLRRITEKTRKSPGKGLEDFRAAVLLASRGSLADAGGAEELRELVANACLEYDDGSGETYTKPARTLFEGLQAGPHAEALSESKLRDLNKLARSLQIISKALGGRRIDGLEHLRASVAEASRTALQALKEGLPEVGDADELRAVLADACCEYDDGSGNVFEPSLRFLLEGFSPEKLAAPFAGSTLEALRKLSRMLQRMSGRLGSPSCKELEQLRLSVVQAMGPLLPGASNAEALCEAITAGCCEYDDASGDIYGKMARTLFGGLKGSDFADALAASESRSLHKLKQVLQRISQAVGHPRSEGLEQLRQALH